VHEIIQKSSFLREAQKRHQTYRAGTDSSACIFRLVLEVPVVHKTVIIS